MPPGQAASVPPPTSTQRWGDVQHRRASCGWPRSPSGERLLERMADVLRVEQVDQLDHLRHGVDAPGGPVREALDLIARRAAGEDEDRAESRLEARDDVGVHS